MNNFNDERYEDVLEDLAEVLNKSHVDFVIVKTFPRIFIGLKPDDIDVLLLNEDDLYSDLASCFAGKGYIIEEFGLSEVRVTKRIQKIPRIDIYNHIKYVGLDFSYIKNQIRAKKGVSINFYKGIPIPRADDTFELLLEALHTLLGHNMFRTDDIIICRYYLKKLASDNSILFKIKSLDHGLLYRLVCEYISLCTKVCRSNPNRKCVPLFSKTLIRSNVSLRVKFKHLLNYVLVAMPLTLYYGIEYRNKDKASTIISRLLQKVLFLYNALIRSTHA